MAQKAVPDEHDISPEWMVIEDKQGERHLVRKQEIHLITGKSSGTVEVWLNGDEDPVLVRGSFEDMMRSFQSRRSSRRNIKDSRNG